MGCIKIKYVAWLLLFPLFGFMIISGCDTNIGKTSQKNENLKTQIETSLSEFNLDDVIDNDKLFIDTWTGSRAICPTCAPDSSWSETGWLVKRPSCKSYDCAWPLSDIVEYNSGIGIKKNGICQTESITVTVITEDSETIYLDIAIGSADNNISFNIPLRFYGTISTEADVCTKRTTTHMTTTGYLSFDMVSLHATISKTSLSITSSSFNTATFKVDATTFGNSTLDTSYLPNAINQLTIFMQQYINDRLLEEVTKKVLPLISSMPGN